MSKHLKEQVHPLNLKKVGKSKILITYFSEASQLDTIKMTKNWLEYDRQTLTLPPKNMLVPSAWKVHQPQLASSHWLGHMPSLTSFLYKKKTSDYFTMKWIFLIKKRRTLDVKLRFVGFKSLVGFDFGQFRSNSKKKVHHSHGSVIFIRSSWFGQVNNPHFSLTMHLKIVSKTSFKVVEQNYFWIHICNFGVRSKPNSSIIISGNDGLCIGCILS